ncbi:MAG: hypothetical protein R3B99_04690 [Polyangiales bacterium]
MNWKILPTFASPGFSAIQSPMPRNTSLDVGPDFFAGVVLTPPYRSHRGFDVTRLGTLLGRVELLRRYDVADLQLPTEAHLLRVLRPRHRDEVASVSLERAVWLSVVAPSPARRVRGAIERPHALGAAELELEDLADLRFARLLLPSKARMPRNTSLDVGPDFFAVGAAAALALGLSFFFGIDS